MTPCPRRALMLAVAGWLALAAPAAAFPPAIDDETGLFSPEALADVAGVARDIKREFGVDLVIDPVRSVPADRAKGLTTRTRRDFFRRWAEERANDAGTRVILILICKNP